MRIDDLDREPDDAIVGLLLLSYRSGPIP